MEHQPVVVDLPADVHQVDETGHVWTLLDGAAEPEMIRSDAVVVAGDEDEPVVARVVDIVERAGQQVVRLEVLGALTGRVVIPVELGPLERSLGVAYVHAVELDPDVRLHAGDHVTLCDEGFRLHDGVVAAVEPGAHGWERYRIRLVEHHPPVDVTAVELLGGTVVRLEFDDSEVRVRDLGPLLWGPVFAPMRDDPAVFAAVRVDPEIGTVAWPNGTDISPELLRYDDLWESAPASRRCACAERRPATITRTADDGRTVEVSAEECVLCGTRWLTEADAIDLDRRLRRTSAPAAVLTERLAELEALAAEHGLSDVQVVGDGELVANVAADRDLVDVYAFEIAAEGLGVGAVHVTVDADDA